jgi:hypothetical protein
MDEESKSEMEVLTSNFTYRFQRFRKVLLLFRLGISKRSVNVNLILSYSGSGTVRGAWKPLW